MGSFFPSFKFLVRRLVAGGHRESQLSRAVVDENTPGPLLQIVFPTHHFSASESCFNPSTTNTTSGSSQFGTPRHHSILKL